MTVDKIYDVISTEKPPIIYISGKTSTGKSTFGRKLRDTLDYHVIELEAVLLDIVRTQSFDEQSTFRKVLYEPGDFTEKTLFFEATDKIIAHALGSAELIVIEGAVANAVTLQRILQPAKDLLFLYFHPDDIDIYIRNLTSRFLESGENSYGGLPLKFWKLINDVEFAEFCKTRTLTNGLKDSIRQYAIASQNESLVRLAEFRQSFTDITVAEIQ